MQPTIWRPVPEFESSYEVSDAGTFRRSSDSGSRAKAGDPITPLRIKNGRLVVRLSRDGTITHRYAHRLVAIAFLGDRPGMEVCHNNGDPTDNRLANLRWDTHAGNMADMARHGTHRNGNREKTECPRGHEYSEKNTRVSATGKRACRSCHAAWQRQLRAAKRDGNTK